MALKKHLYPRLLVIDMTPVGHISATGQLKKTFLGDWPTDKFLQLWNLQASQKQIHIKRLSQPVIEAETPAYSVSEAAQIAVNFKPDIIYFRPVDMDVLFDVTELILSKTKKPLVIHIMDDWPERLRITNTEKFSNLNPRLLKLIKRAKTLISISEAMSHAYSKRYGGKWYPLANGVDRSEFIFKNWEKRPPVSPENPFVVRYMGGLAEDMSLSSVSDVAVVISILSSRIPVRFEIYTMDWYLNKAKTRFQILNAVSVNKLVEEDQYKSLLSEADALLIAYNFDENTCIYTRLSMANKMPECFVSGAAVIAYGPSSIATIDFIDKTGSASVIKQSDFRLLRAAILKLINDKHFCAELSKKGQEMVKSKLSKKQVQDKFLSFILKASKNKT